MNDQMTLVIEVGPFAFLLLAILIAGNVFVRLRK
jgi:hypothetical protein